MLENILQIVKNVLSSLPIQSARLRGEGKERSKTSLVEFLAEVKTNHHTLFFTYHAGLQGHGDEVCVSYINLVKSRVEQLATFGTDGLEQKLHYLLRNLTHCEYCVNMVINAS
jgi:hypothetical protein